MIIARDRPALKRALAGLDRPLALIPTMGALHEGHMALLAEGQHQAASTLASIFVNPLQFAAGEGFDRYPRDDARDLALLELTGCRVAWLPTVETMYPPGCATTIEVGGPAEGFEGAVRPGYFRGVATVVAKLLHRVEPELVLFGEKDWQQLQVVRRMVADLDWPVRIVAVPILREADGLAMSSRNRYLTREQRAVAPGLFRVMQEVAQAGADPAALEHGASALRAMGMEPDYLALVEAETMRPILVPNHSARLVAAARLDTVRLLDNMAIPATSLAHQDEDHQEEIDVTICSPDDPERMPNGAYPGSQQTPLDTTNTNRLDR